MLAVVATAALSRCSPSDLSRFQPEDWRALLPPLCNSSFARERTRCLFRNADGTTWSRTRSSDTVVYHQNLGDFARLGHALQHASGEAIEMVIDGGANSGMSTRLFAEAWPSARVVAVEPLAENYAVARLNTEGLDNVRVLRAAIFGSTPDEFYNEQGGSELRTRPLAMNSLGVGNEYAASVRPAASNSPDVLAGLSMQQLMRCSGAARLGFLKLDIEGAETSLLPGGERGWLRHVSFLYLEAHVGSNTRALPSVLAPLFSVGMSVLTFPELKSGRTFLPQELRKPGTRWWWLNSYFACAEGLGAARCAAACNEWRNGSEVSCREVPAAEASATIAQRGPRAASQD